MLHLLLLVSSLGVVTGGLEKTFNVSSCPMNFYGVTSDKIKVLSEHGGLTLRVNPANLNNGIHLTDKIASDVTLHLGVTLPRHMMTRMKDLTPYNTVQCTWKLTIGGSGFQPFDIYYANIGSHSVLYLEHFLDFKRIIASEEELLERQALVLCDLTACPRGEGEKVKRVSSAELLSMCSKFKGCHSNKTFILEDMCGGRKCGDRGRCLVDVSCTAVGSLVIDSANNQKHLSDRCMYVLLANMEILLLGQFNYRRSTHVPFLDSLRLKAGDNTFQLLQGGRVTVNDHKVNLNSSARVFHGVEMFKDENGVSLKMTLSNGDLSISFDGTVAHISAPGREENSGLCVKSSDSDVKKSRHMDLSDNSCREEFDDEKRESADCPKLRKRCKAVFSNDTTRVFIKACKGLLCAYGDVDDLFCRLQAAFTHRTGISLTDQSCEGSSPCLNHHCASHEFCGLKDNEEATCVCRESFMYPFRKGGKYGEKTTCTVDTASVELPVCLVEDRGFEASELHLLDPECKGQVDDDEHMMTFTFTHRNTCGAKISANKSHIIYKNTVTVFAPEDDVITRDDMIYLNFSCSYEPPESSPMTITILDGSVIQLFMMGLYKYSLVQRACSDHMCHKELKAGEEHRLGETMWIHLDVEKLDTRVALVIDSCWGSVLEKGGGETKHKLVTNGCADRGDRTVRVTENGDGDHCSFRFKVFRFIKHPGVVHMHCTVRMCLKGENNRCRPKCNGKPAPPETPGVPRPETPGVARPETPGVPPPVTVVYYYGGPSRRRRSVDSLGTVTFTSVSWVDQGALVQ